MDPYDYRKKIDKILVKPTQADEVRKLCYEIEKIKMSGQGLSKEEAVLKKIELPEFYNKILDMHRPYKNMNTIEKQNRHFKKKKEIDLKDL